MVGTTSPSSASKPGACSRITFTSAGITPAFTFSNLVRRPASSTPSFFWRRRSSPLTELTRPGRVLPSYLSQTSWRYCSRAPRRLRPPGSQYNRTSRVGLTRKKLVMVTKAPVTQMGAQTRLPVALAFPTSVLLQIRLLPPEAALFPAALTGPHMRPTHTCEIHPPRSGRPIPCSPSSSSASTVACS